MITSSKSKMKVIKREAAGAYKTPVAVVEKKQNQTVARQIASNVSGWVSEFQQRRGDEQRQAFNILFALQN